METYTIKQFGEAGLERILQRFRMIDPGSEFFAFDRCQLQDPRNINLVEKLVNQAYLPFHKINFAFSQFGDNTLVICRKCSDGSINVVGYALYFCFSDGNEHEHYAIDDDFKMIMQIN